MSNTVKLNGYSSAGEAGTRRRMVETESDGLSSTHEGDVGEVTAKYSAINPFIHRIELSTLGKIKVAFMTVTVFPIRLILIGIVLLIAWFFAYLALLGRSKEDEKQPMTGWRRSLRPLAVFFARGVFFFGGFHWVTVKGKRATSAEAPILAVAPHSSYLDALPVTYLGLTSVVAKTEAEDVPIFGTLTKFTQPVLVSREDPCSRQNTVLEIQRRAATGGEWPQIVVFAEGTCTNRSCLINFKPGAFIPGVPVQPVCLKYKNKLDTATWTWNGPGAFKIMWLTFCQFNSSFEIEFLPVYVPTEEEKKDVKLFGRNVRSQMALALGVPTAENSFEDGQAMTNACELHLENNAEILVHINRTVRQLGLSQDELKERVSNLCTVVQSTSSSHLVKLDEFASHLKSSPSSQPLIELFSLLAESGENVVDLRRCLIVFHLLRLPRSAEDVFQFAFSVYDCGRKGYLSTVELKDMLTALHLPLPVTTLLSNCGGDEGPTVHITYDVFKASAEKLPEYEKYFPQRKSVDRKKHSCSSKPVVEKKQKSA